MTIAIDEAIRVNTVLKEAPVLKNDPVVIATLNLNIEALNLVKQLQSLPGRRESFRLPGETKE